MVREELGEIARGERGGGEGQARGREGRGGREGGTKGPRGKEGECTRGPAF